jgi:hypothetical protein
VSLYLLSESFVDVVCESMRESVDNSLIESLSESILVESESFVDVVSESLRESVDNSLLEWMVMTACL